MNIMKTSAVLFFVLFPQLSSLHAAENSTQIGINFRFGDFVQLKGSLVNASLNYNVDDIEPANASSSGPKITMGTLGLSSNNTRNCVVTFSTQHDFALRHIKSQQKLTNYRIIWKGTDVKRLPNRELAMSCDSVSSNFEFQAEGTFLDNAGSGIYQDTMMLTVTTQ